MASAAMPSPADKNIAPLVFGDQGGAAAPALPKYRSALSATRATLFLVAALLTVVLALTGCQSTDTGTYTNLVPMPPGPGSADYSTNVFHEGDTLAVTFLYSTNFDTVSKVALDGMINLESIGQVKAAGKTPVDLGNELEKLYKPQIKDDVVTVKLINAVSSVYVCGAVFRPGKVPMERPMTVLEAVMEAGGYDPTRAKLTDATVLRVQNGHQRTYRLNLKKMLAGEDPDPFYLKPFDIVNVPMKMFNF